MQDTRSGNNRKSGTTFALLCVLIGGAGVTQAGGQAPAPLSGGLSGPAPAAASPSAASLRLAAALDAVLDAPALQSDFVGAIVVRARDSQILYARNADRVFLPASNNKLLTSFAALQTLPPDFAYRTRVVAPDGRDESGTVRGDLVLVGGGDPLLSFNDLDALARQVAASGARDIRGGLRYDDTRYDRQGLGDGWTWDDEAASYSAQISALNVNENCVSVQVLPGKRVGDPVRVQVTPAAAPVRVDNQGVTGMAQRASSLIIDRMRGQNVITVTGTLPLDAALQTRPPVDVTVEDPARFTATLFAAALRRAGVRVHDRKILPVVAAVRPDSAASRILAERFSPPLPQLLLRMNKPSDNLMAECLLKAVGAFGNAGNMGSIGNAGNTENSGSPGVAGGVGSVSSAAIANSAGRGDGGSRAALSSPTLDAALSAAPAVISAPAFRVGTSGYNGTGAQLARQAFRTAGMNIEAARQADGSGLSRGNYVSPRNLVRLLLYAHSQPYFPAFYASLPIAGVDGTLRNRMKNTPALNNCHAKTGSLSHVSALSGYVTTRDGELLAFSLLLNNHLGPMRACTSAQDSIVALLAAFTANANTTDAGELTRPDLLCASCR